MADLLMMIRIDGENRNVIIMKCCKNKNRSSKMSNKEKKNIKQHKKALEGC